MIYFFILCVCVLDISTTQSMLVEYEAHAALAKLLYVETNEVIYISLICVRFLLINYFVFISDTAGQSSRRIK